MEDNKTQNTCDPSSGCCSSDKNQDTAVNKTIVRRDFLKAMGLATGGFLLGLPAISFGQSKSKHGFLDDKDLPEGWFENLYKEESQKFIREKI